jgi:hypothetical protein
MPYPANSSQYELNTFTPIKHREREREKYHGKEKQEPLEKRKATICM